jgi:hypothetical protein
MKKLACGLAAVALIASTATAITRLGENAELFLTGTLGARTDDNIFLGDLDEVDDTILEVAPGVELVFGQGARLNGRLRLAETFVRYLDNSDLDDELFTGEFLSGYDDGKWKFDLELSYDQLNESTRDVRGAGVVFNELINRDALHGAVNALLSVSDKTSAGLGFTYEETSYDTTAPGYLDIEEFSVPFNYFYAIGEKVDLSAGVRFRDTALSGGAGDSRDFYYNLGARGDFTPKFSGTVSVGYNQRELDAGGDESALGAEAKLKYLITEKTSLGLNVLNDFTTSAEGVSQKTFAVTPSVGTRFGEQWDGALSVSFQRIEYFSGRDDDYVDGRASLGCRLNENATVRVGYLYRKNESNLRVLDSLGRTRSPEFTNQQISLTAVLRF